MRKVLSILLLLAMLVTTVSPALAQDAPDGGDASPHIYLPVIAGDGSAAQLAAPEQPAQPTPDTNPPAETEHPAEVEHGQAMVMTAAMPSGPTDESVVPHYFGPNPNWANSPFTLPDVAVEITGDGTGATAEATVGANGTVTGLVLTNPGAGYSAATVNFTGGGNGAAAAATVAASGAVIAIDVTAGGAGYTAPTVAFLGGGGSGTLVQKGNQLIDRAYATDFPPEAAPRPVFAIIPDPLPAGTLTDFLSWNQAGAGGSPTPSAGETFYAYVLRPVAPSQYTVVFASALLTVPPLADPDVSELATYNVGTVPVQAGDLIAFYGAGIPVDTSAGADVVSYLAPAAPVAEATITMGDPATFPLLGGTRTYSFGASVIDASGVVPLTPATATAYGAINAIQLTSGGSGYTFPTVDIDYPDASDGVQATANAEFDPATGAITAINITNPGSGYSAAPNVVIRNGTAYDPIRDTGTGAAAVATLGVTSIIVNTPGDGYISAPTVIINDPTGTGAEAMAQVNAGAITGLTLMAGGSGYVTTGGIKKFTDALPNLCAPPDCPISGKYLPVAVAETKNYNGIAADEYVIGLVQYRTSFSSSLPETLVRGYAQIETAANADVSQHFPLMTANVDPGQPDTPVLINGQQAYAVTAPQFLGPVIAATKDKPVRIVFHNLLPTGEGGDLFLPVDSTMMGSGMGPMAMGDPVNDNSVTDMVRNPACSQWPKPADCFKDDRATLHLHGGITPWISDGTPHQWITPAGENTMWPQGVSVENVPDMNVCQADDDGCQTFYYTNQQSARFMFYHDHAWGITRLNVYAGEAAGYLIADNTEQALVASGAIPAAQIPLVVQDRTFVPQDTQLYNQVDATTGSVTSYGQDPTWDQARWGGYGNLWYHHVYMPAQNPGDPSGMSAYGRWMYGPWFWPPAANTVYGPIPNPYYDPNCNLDDPATWQYQTDPFCEPQQIPGTPNISAGMEQFNDTPIVNGVAYPTLTLEPKAYRLRILNAANDRFFNFQWYVGDPSTASTGTNVAGEVIGATEVAMNPAEIAAAQVDPNIFPTPIQGPATAGPDWIQIGTEGGFLPAPVVVDGQQVTTWITDPTRFDVGNVDKHSLLLAPAERADVIVDFSQFAGKTLILYNDAPAAFPARVASYDYYTDAPDLSPVGAPKILPGYGPNTRTIMQIKIAASAPAPAFGLAKLEAAFRHTASGTGVFESGQHPIIVGQAAYNSAYGANFAPSSNCNAPGSTVQRCDGLVRVNDTQSFGFNTLLSPNNKVTMPLQPKAIHDEMNATTFDEFGRMQANLGVEAQPPTPGAQNVTLYPYVNPQTELIDATNLPRADVIQDADGNPVGDVKITPIANMADGSQIWRITHNGVDTHPIHFHLYDVQLVNRVTWDNIIIPTDATELGWKDTVRVAPLEDTIVALRPIIPELPWELPNAIRELNPMMMAGSGAMFNNIDPQGNPTAPVTNQLVNFGWEYVYHCHILSHEEMDMMRPVSVAMPPVTPDRLAWAVTGNGGNTRLTLTWYDNSIAETAYVVQRQNGANGDWTNLATLTQPLDQPNTSGTQRSFTDTTFRWNATLYSYRVVAQNTIGYGAEFPSMTVVSTSAAVPVVAAPTNLAATLLAGPQVRLTWTDNAANETEFIIQRSTDGVNFTNLGTVGPRNNTGSVSATDLTVDLGTTYWYRVAANSAAGLSQWSNVASIVVAVAIAPTNFAAANGQNQGSRRSVVLTWTDSPNETGYTIQRATDATFTAGLNTANVGANVTTITQTGLSRNTAYYYRIRANNVLGSSAWLDATPPFILTNP